MGIKDYKWWFPMTINSCELWYATTGPKDNLKRYWTKVPVLTPFINRSEAEKASNRLEIKKALPQLGGNSDWSMESKDQLMLFYQQVLATGGDAGLALLRFKQAIKPVGSRKRGWKKSNRYTHVNGPIHPALNQSIKCNACDFKTREKDKGLALERMQAHVGQCLEWDALDAKASTLLFGDDLASPYVQLDVLISNGDI